MTNEKSVIDYTSEVAKLVDREERNWWDVVGGQHVITIPDPLGGDEFSGTDYKGNPVQKVRYNIKVNNKDYDWSITKGKTKTSLWGQLALLIASKGDQVKDLVFNLVVKGDGTARQYTILEALPLLPKKQ